VRDHKKKPIEGEIVTPAQLDRILGQSQEPDIPALDALLERFEQLFKESLKVTNLDSPEGWFGEFFGGMDYRIAVKTERGQALFGLIDTFMNNLDQFEKVEQKIRAINRERYERYIDRVRAARTALEEQQKLEAVVANARLQLQIEEAKAREAIAIHEGNIRKAGLEGRPSPPPSSSAPPPNMDECERQRQAAQKRRKLDYDLKLDALEAEENHQDAIANRALTRILKIFAEPETLQAQKRFRIRQLRDTYAIDEALLPQGVLELMQEEDVP